MTKVAFKNRIVGQGTDSPDNLLANPFNWRIHSDYQKTVLEGALEQIGWIQQIIVNQRTGHIIDGHLRAKLAIDRGEPAVPVIYVDLTEDEEKLALATIDPIAALATTDQEKLDDILKAIEAQNEALAEFLGTLASAPTLQSWERNGNTDDDDVPPVQPVIITKPGDVWILGQHRLVCTDCTDREAVQAAFNGEQADMVWTDPPYNVDYGAKNEFLNRFDKGRRKTSKIENDKLTDAAFQAFLVAAFRTAAAMTKDGAPLYIAHSDSEAPAFRRAIEAAGLVYKQNLVWVKNHFALSRWDYHPQHEPIIYAKKDGAPCPWYGDRTGKSVIDQFDIDGMSHEEAIKALKAIAAAFETSVIRHDKPAANDVHPTMKPVGLITPMIFNSSKQGDIVLDIFGGSGSTLIAAEKLSRRCFVTEKQPEYCDVIIRRFQDFTGTEAVRERDGARFNELASV